MSADQRVKFILPSSHESELQGLLRQCNQAGDAGFSERLWNVAIQAYVRTHGAHPALN